MQSILNLFSYWDSALAVILVLGGLIFFHELGHLVLMNSEFESVFKCAKAAHYKECGFEHEHGIYWDCEGYYDYYEKHHDADPEENIVSLFATYIVGANYDRTWWQKQKAALRGKEDPK